MCSNTSTDVIISNDSYLNGISCIGVENTVPFANKSDAYSFNGKLAASIPLASTPLCLNFLTITAVPHPASNNVLNLYLFLIPSKNLHEWHTFAPERNL